MGKQNDTQLGGKEKEALKIAVGDESDESTKYKILKEIRMDLLLCVFLFLHPNQFFPPSSPPIPSPPYPLFQHPFTQPTLLLFRKEWASHGYQSTMVY